MAVLFERGVARKTVQDPALSPVGLHSPEKKKREQFTTKHWYLHIRQIR